jgi:DNA topoisomerase-1
LPERELDIPERNIWNLIVRRFMAVFGDPAIRQSIRVCVNINGHRFYLRGIQTLKEGWLHFYEPYARSEEVILPPVSEGQTVKIKRVISEDKSTKPPPRYNPGSLLRKMEEAEIGTKATRASVIQTLYNRKYIRDERMIVTDLGFEVVEVLEKYCPTVVSIKLTRKLEEEMGKIQVNSEKRENVLLEAVEMLKLATEELKSNERMVGEQLSNALKTARIEERIIGICPICHDGKLIILYSRKTGKRFAGCTNYFKGQCKASFPLPQKGMLIPLGKNCRGCGWPIVQIRSRERRSWTLCLNPRCPLKEERRKRIAMQSVQ